MLERERGGVGYLGMYYFQMERRLGGKEEGLDKVAEDQLARFLFILCSATIGGENWVATEKLEKLQKRKNVLIFLPQFNWLSYGHGHGQHIHGHICMVIIWSRLQSRISSVKIDQNGTLILNSNVWHIAHSSQSGFACTAKKR